MKTYRVTIPIAGHIVFDVEAEDEAAATTAAFNEDVAKGELGWEMLESFGTGNVCHCPYPWETEVEEIDSDD
jgi:hypothetical protein